MKINFKKFEVEVSFDGHKQTFDIAKDFGNFMKYGSSVMGDIGFEDLAKEIYYSDGDVEIDEKYKSALIQVVNESKYVSAIKRELIKKLS